MLRFFRVLSIDTRFFSKIFGVQILRYITCDILWLRMKDLYIIMVHLYPAGWFVSGLLMPHTRTGRVSQFLYRWRLSRIQNSFQTSASTMLSSIFIYFCIQIDLICGWIVVWLVYDMRAPPAAISYLFVYDRYFSSVFLPHRILVDTFFRTLFL